MTEEGAFALLAGMGIIAIVLVLIGLAVLIATIIAQWKIFKKSGKNGWEALIPFYNKWVLIEIAGLNWWYFLISIGISLISLLVPQLSVVAYLGSMYINFIIYYNLSKKLKQNEILYGILGVIITIVPTFVISYSKNFQYDNKVEVKPNALF